MALQDILDKISQQTEEKLKQLATQFENEKKRLAEENDRKKGKISEDMEKKVEDNQRKIMEKAETLAERETKNQILTAKHKVLEEALEEAANKLSKAENYEEILAGMMQKIQIQDDAVIIPARGKEEATKKALQKSGKSFSISEKSANIKGGFILQTDTLEIDNSFETIIKNQLRSELEIKLHKLLFT